MTTFCYSGPFGPPLPYPPYEGRSCSEETDEHVSAGSPNLPYGGPFIGYPPAPPDTPGAPDYGYGVPPQDPLLQHSVRRSYPRHSSRAYFDGVGYCPASMLHAASPASWELPFFGCGSSLPPSGPYQRQLSSASAFGYSAEIPPADFAASPILGLPRLAYESEVALVHFAVYLICAVGCVCVYYNLVVLEAYVLALFWAVVFSIPLRTAMNVLKRLILLSAQPSIDAVAASQAGAASAGPTQLSHRSSLASAAPPVTASAIFMHSPPRLASSASSALTGECHTGTPPPEGTGGFVPPQVYRHRSTSESIATRIASRLLPSVAPTAAAAESLLAQENLVIAEKLGKVSDTLKEVLERESEESQPPLTQSADMPVTPPSSEHTQPEAGSLAGPESQARGPQQLEETQDAIAPEYREASPVVPAAGRREGESVAPRPLPTSENADEEASASHTFDGTLTGAWTKEACEYSQERCEDGEGNPPRAGNPRGDKLRVPASTPAQRSRGWGGGGGGRLKTPSSRQPWGKKNGGVRRGWSPHRVPGSLEGASAEAKTGGGPAGRRHKGSDAPCVGCLARQPSWSLLGDVFLSSFLVRLPARFLLFMLAPLQSLVSPSPPGHAGSGRHASRPWFALLYRTCLVLLVYRVISSYTRYSLSTVLLCAAGVGLFALIVRFVLIVAGKEEAANKSLAWLSQPWMFKPLRRLLMLFHGSMQSSLNPLLAIIVMLTSVLILCLIVAFFCFQFYNEITLLWDAFQRIIDTYILRSSTMQQAMQTIHSFAGSPEADPGPSSTLHNTTIPSASAPPLSASQIIFNLITKAAEAASASSSGGTSEGGGPHAGGPAGGEAEAGSVGAASQPVQGLPTGVAGAVGSLSATIAAAIAAGASRAGGGRAGAAAAESSASPLRQLLGGSIGRYSDLWLSIRHLAANASAGAPAAGLSEVSGSARGASSGSAPGEPAGGVHWQNGGAENIPVVIVRAQSPQEPGVPALDLPPATPDSTRGSSAAPPLKASHGPRAARIRGGGRRRRRRTKEAATADARAGRSAEEWRGGAGLTSSLGALETTGTGARGLWRGFFDGKPAATAASTAPSSAFGATLCSSAGDATKELDWFEALEEEDEDGAGRKTACPEDPVRRGARVSVGRLGGGASANGVRDAAREGARNDELEGASREVGSTGKAESPEATDLVGWAPQGQALQDAGPAARGDELASWGAKGEEEDADASLHEGVWKRWENTAELIGQLRRGNLSGAAGKAKEAWNEIYSLTSEGWWSYVTTYANTFFSGLLNSGFGAARVFFFVCFLVFRFFLSAFDMLLQAVVFFSALYYLLCSSRSCLEYLEELLCIVDPSCIISHSINRGLRAILYSSFKRFWFYSLFTWFVYESAGMPVVYVPTAVSGLLALLPLLPPESISVIPCLVLWWGSGAEDAARAAGAPAVQRADEPSAGLSGGTAATAWWAVLHVAAASQRKLGAVALFAANAAVWWNVTTAIYREIPDSNPWLVGLSVALGLSTFGLKGIIIGPVLATIPLIVLTAAAKFSERRAREHQLAAMVAQQTAGSPLRSPTGFRSAVGSFSGASSLCKKTPSAKRRRAQTPSRPAAPGAAAGGAVAESRAEATSSDRAKQGADSSRAYPDSGAAPPPEGRHDASSESSGEERFSGAAIPGIEDVISGPPSTPAAGLAAAELAAAANAAAVAEVTALVGEAGGAVVSAPVVAAAQKLTGQRLSAKALRQQPQPPVCDPPTQLLPLAGALATTPQASPSSGERGPPDPASRRVFLGGAPAPTPPSVLRSSWAPERVGVAGVPASPFAVPGPAVGAACPPGSLPLAGSETSSETDSSRRSSMSSDSRASSSAGQADELWWSLSGDRGDHPPFFRLAAEDGRAPAPQLRASVPRTGPRAAAAGKQHVLGAVESRPWKSVGAGLGDLRRFRDPRLFFWALHQRKPSKRSRAICSGLPRVGAWTHHLGHFAGRASAVPGVRGRHGWSHSKGAGRCRTREGEAAAWNDAREAAVLSANDAPAPPSGVFLECAGGRPHARVAALETSRSVLLGAPAADAVAPPPLYQRMLAAWSPTDVREVGCGGELATARTSARRGSLPGGPRSAPQVGGGGLGRARTLEASDAEGKSAERRSVSKPEQGGGGESEEKVRSSSMLAAAVLKTAEKLEWLLERPSGGAAGASAAVETRGAHEAAADSGETAAAAPAKRVGETSARLSRKSQRAAREGSDALTRPVCGDGMRRPPFGPAAADPRGAGSGVSRRESGAEGGGDAQASRPSSGVEKPHAEKAKNSARGRASLPTSGAGRDASVEGAKRRASRRQGRGKKDAPPEEYRETPRDGRQIDIQTRKM
ncbi:hypothetical protein BESB_069440 [Besnoitia besnoiti]|uniref:Transmembrane protein n=1 Tax=Besnoitia besnoiti TaxID=94643 RepID=A0A2A9MF74_BESBE|nr:hypothetical protein BESB_069440 [Besnoitia besnoiti]PFH34911.1 hypothetical protein BESB_069440 [Besnoitia besnoiti]